MTLHNAMVSSLVFTLAVAVSEEQLPRAGATFAELRASGPCRTDDGREILFALNQEEVDAMLKVAKVTSRDRVYDLTYGDGRLVTSAATRYGARAVALPVCTLGVSEARKNVETAGVADKVSVLDQDFFTADLSGATVVTLLLMPSLNERLLPKLMQLKPGTRIVSWTFTVGDWPPEVSLGQVGPRKSTIYRWTVARAAGRRGRALSASSDTQVSVIPGRSPVLKCLDAVDSGFTGAGYWVTRKPEALTSALEASLPAGHPVFSIGGPRDVCPMQPEREYELLT
jgi:hypothetical protein